MRSVLDDVECVNSALPSQVRGNHSASKMRRDSESNLNGVIKPERPDKRVTLQKKEELKTRTVLQTVAITLAKCGDADMA